MKNSKLLVSIVLALMLVMVFSFTAMAADQPVAINADQPTPISAIQPIAIQLDGKNIATGDVAPVIVDGRTFIPFRVLFEAMGATVSYNEDTRTVSATKDKLAINFAVGQKDITVTQDNKKEVITTDAASFISNGRTLVPVRFAAQSLGATVGWDAAKRTVLIADTNKLIKAYAGKFTIMDMLLADSAQQAKQSYAFTGTMKMNLKITDEGKAYPMIMDAKMTGISSATAMEMNVKMSISMDELIKEAIAADATTKEQLEAMAAQLKNIDCDYIMDLSTGIYYLKADIFSTALDLEKGTWISIDLNKMLQDLGLEELGLGSVEDLNKLSTFGTFDQILAAVVSSTPLTDVNSYNQLIESLTAVETLLADGSFVKSGNTYTAKTQVTAEGMTINFVLTVNKTAKDALDSYEIKLDIAEGTTSMLSLNASQNAAEKMTLKMTANIPDLLTFNLDAEMQYTKTTKVPALKPAAGDKISPLDLAALLGGTTTK